MDPAWLTEAWEGRFRAGLAARDQGSKPHLVSRGIVSCGPEHPRRCSGKEVFPPPRPPRHTTASWVRSGPSPGVPRTPGSTGSERFHYTRTVSH